MSGAIAGTFADFKLIRTRDVVQIVIEVPREKADAALAALGGLPKPGAEQWVALAPLKAEAAVEHDRKAQAQPPAEPLERKPMPLPSRVALTCQSPSFQQFLSSHRPFSWEAAQISVGHSTDLKLSKEAWAADVVKTFCGVESRKEIVPGSPAAEGWADLEAQYHHWQRAGAAA